MIPTFFKRIRSGKHVTGEDIQRDLVDFHSVKPGITEVTYGRCKTPEGKTSYEVLLDAACDLKGMTVVDLACGNGPLTELVASRFSNVGHLVGVDLCKEDLAFARQRVPQKNVEFLCESAQNLSLPSHSVDCILCHMAFMLFNPLEPAIVEIKRLLRPGGLFACVVSGFEHEPSLFVETVHILKTLVSQVYPAFKDFGWGDPRTHSRQGFLSLFPNVDIHHYSIVVKEEPAKLATLLPHFFYSTDFLDDAAKTVLIQKWTKLFEHHLGPDGEVEFLFPLSRVVVR